MADIEKTKKANEPLTNLEKVSKLPTKLAYVIFLL